MSKNSKTQFVCRECGFDSAKWYGRCPECGNWNSFDEIALETKSENKKIIDFNSSQRPQSMDKIKSVRENRISTGFEEFDRVLGGSPGIPGSMGIVPGSAILLSGDPGVGKSTLLLQLALSLAADGQKVLYVTGEESEGQVKLRAERIELKKSAVNQNLLIFSTSDIDRALEHAALEKCNLLIVDSIQTMGSADFTGFPGSVPQIRNCTARIVAFAKKNSVPTFLIGHVTKEGSVAGPMILSHMVDTVLFLEGEKITGTRVLRSFKNRFGDTSEVGIFLMDEKGLSQIQDISDFFVDKNSQKVPGSCLTVVMEGSRPIIVEVQALVVPTNMTFARRVANGISEKRLELLLAVIQKHTHIHLEKMDVFVNIVGGLKISETASDLAICLALISSFKAKSISSSVAIGEVGLLGEIKSVSNLEKRIREANKFGFKNVITVNQGKFLNEAISRAFKR